VTQKTMQATALPATVWREAAKRMISTVADAEMRIDLWECLTIWTSWLTTNMGLDRVQAERLAARKLLSVIKALPRALRLPVRREPRRLPAGRCSCAALGPLTITRDEGLAR
jgi:uncharacterized protein (DUF2236 family)